MTGFVYLCGPIAGCTDGEAVNWRNEAKWQIGEERCLDPMRRDYRGRVTAEVVAEIVELDKLDVVSSHVVLANRWKAGDGTPMEILYAWQHHIPVITVVPPRQPVSPWIRYHSAHVVDSLFDAFKWVRFYLEEI